MIAGGAKALLDAAKRHVARADDCGALARMVVNMYEGPIHNAQIERVRRQSGVWSPLYLGAATPAPAETKPDDSEIDARCVVCAKPIRYGERCRAHRNAGAPAEKEAGAVTDARIDHLIEAHVGAFELDDDGYESLLKFGRSVWEATLAAPREAQPVAVPQEREAMARELLRIANILRDCGRLISISGKSEASLRKASAMLAAAPGAAAPAAPQPLLAGDDNPEGRA